MAGMLQNRSRPTRLALQMAATLRNSQAHTCPDCGRIVSGPCVYGRGYRPPKCADCASTMYPAWTVRDSRGRVRGFVYGGSETDAEESARQAPKYDRLKGFCVIPASTAEAQSTR